MTTSTARATVAAAARRDEGDSEMPVRRYRRFVSDRSRKAFHNQVAVVLTVLTLAMLLGLSAVFGKNGPFDGRRNSANASTVGRAGPDVSEYDDADHEASLARWLEDGDDGGDNDGSKYAYISCQYIYDKTPDPGHDQCLFARNCNGGSGVFASWVFCSEKFSVLTLFLVLSPFLLTWMVTLFRMLGSTAEDYFSPSLEMFSVKLGLPPRFAGVSLLALGNGAADVSATMSAIVSDEENGYKLALGALTGAAMLVGGVISGVVVLVAGGVPCRGALIRDVTALIVTVIAVWSSLGQGEIGPSSITMFLTLYALFVCIVLIADVYHRAVVIPRLAAVADDQELARQISAERQVNEAAMVPPGAATEGTNMLAMQQQPDVSMSNSQGSTASSSAPSALSRVITAISNYDNPTQDNNAGTGTAGGGWGVDSEQLEQDRPIVLHGQNGILSDNSRNLDRQQSSPASPSADESGAYALVDDTMDQMCIAPNTGSYSASNWSGAWEDGNKELRDHAAQVWEDIYYDADVGVTEKFLLTCELPFTFLRKVTVPIPCEGYYNRGLVALSMVVSPLWFAYYLYDGHDINVFSSGTVVYFLISWAFSVAIAAMLLRFAPGGEGEMALSFATPIALYGFCIAATWIDFIADHLVSLLNFIGIVLHIPGTIMGLTILAWGNSMGDLSANLTMARKGLANMAMTACFAGPVFNILMGLGLGFSSLAGNTGNAFASVSLSPSVVVGFVFILLNGISIVATGLLFGNGKIKPYYGYIALTLYTCYLVASVGLQFSKYGDD